MNLNRIFLNLLYHPAFRYPKTEQTYLLTFKQTNHDYRNCAGSSPLLYLRHFQPIHSDQELEYSHPKHATGHHGILRPCG